MFRMILILALLLPTSAFATTYYIDDTGGTDDGVCDGTPACDTFDHVIPLLDPGDTLIVRNGTYTLANNGLPRVTCGSGGMVDGTMEMQITIQAETERQAFIDGSTSGAGRETVEITNCEYWKIIGLYMRNSPTGVDLGGSGWGSVLFLTNSSHITVRRNVLTDSNHCENTALIGLINSNDNLFEENEGYSFSRNGFGGDGNNNIWRRNYLNSRLFADLPCQASNDPTRGDAAFIVYSNFGSGSGNIYENNISENNFIGFRLAGAGTTANNQFHGNISLNDRFGFWAESREGAVGTTTVSNQVSILSTHAGIQFTAVNGGTCTNCSVFDAGGVSGRGIYLDATGSWGNPTMTPGNVTVTNALGFSSDMADFEVVDQTSWSLNFTASTTGNLSEYTVQGGGGSIANRFTSTPTNMGASGCYAYVHASSNLKVAGFEMADIGANVLYRYVNAILTSVPLWDLDGSGSPDGTFPRGATITSGVNDDASHNNDVLEDVHERLNINTAGCPFPAGYGSAGSGTITVVWPYPAQQIFKRPSAAIMSIEWTSTDITGNVDLEYSTDNGSNYAAIATVAYNSSPYSFNADTARVPSTTQFLIRVKQGAVSDTSDSTATVRGRYLK